MSRIAFNPLTIKAHQEASRMVVISPKHPAQATVRELSQLVASPDTMSIRCVRPVVKMWTKVSQPSQWSNLSAEC